MLFEWKLVDEKIHAMDDNHLDERNYLNYFGINVAYRMQWHAMAHLAMYVRWFLCLSTC